MSILDYTESPLPIYKAPSPATQKNPQKQFSINPRRPVKKKKQKNPSILIQISYSRRRRPRNRSAICAELFRFGQVGLVPQGAGAKRISLPLEGWSKHSSGSGSGSAGVGYWEYKQRARGQYRSPPSRSGALMYCSGRRSTTTATTTTTAPLGKYVFYARDEERGAAPRINVGDFLFQDDARASMPTSPPACPPPVNTQVCEGRYFMPRFSGFYYERERREKNSCVRVLAGACVG